MNLRYITIVLVIALTLQAQQACFAQMSQPRADQQDSSYERFRNSWGMDILISTGGIGLGGFYRHEFTKNVSGFFTLSISESKDDREVEYSDLYGNIFTPGKINRFLVIPLMIGVEQRLFSNQILDNFRPYLSAAFGPTMIYTTPYREEFFNALGKGHPQYTVGGYIGGGAYFGSDRSALFGISIRYYIVPFGPGIESLEAGPYKTYKKEFGGFFITLNLGNVW